MGSGPTSLIALIALIEALEQPAQCRQSLPIALSASRLHGSDAAWTSMPSASSSHARAAAATLSIDRVRLPVSQCPMTD